MADQVQSRLEELLRGGHLMPDARLSLRDLSAQLGVSTMPVREAVSRLVAQGALVTERNRAIVVPRLDADEFRDLTDIRILTEVAALRRAMPHVDADLVARLRGLDRAFGEAMSDPKATNAVQINFELHFAIYEAARSPSLRRIIATSWLRAGPMISLDIGLPSRRQRTANSVQAHHDMVEAIARGDEEAAAEALTRDIRSTADYIITQVMGG